MPDIKLHLTIKSVYSLQKTFVYLSWLNSIVSLTYRKLLMQSRLSSLSKQKGMIKDDFNVSWYEVSATNTSLFDRSIVQFGKVGKIFTDSTFPDQ